MFIRHLIGPRKGEIEEVIFDRAKAKVLAGEAEDVYNQLGLPATTPEMNTVLEPASVTTGTNTDETTVPIKKSKDRWKLPRR
jgi:hypothetical protein